MSVVAKKKMTLREARKLARDLGINENQIANLGEGLYGTVVKITPSLAEYWLERNTNNRTKKLRTAERYTKDILTDRWRTTHEALAFSQNGLLADGQHRLYAVVEAGKPIKALVVLGLNDDDAVFIDEGISRSAIDAAQIKGVDCQRVELGTVKAAYNGYDRLARPISNPESLDLYKHYKEGLDFVEENLPYVKGITSSAIVRGVVVRAFYFFKNDPDSLSRIKLFCQILADGQYGGRQRDKMAAQLRDRLMKEKFFGRQKELYSLVEKALSLFIEGKCLARIKPANNEMFPLTDGMPPTTESDSFLMN